MLALFILDIIRLSAEGFNSYFIMRTEHSNLLNFYGAAVCRIIRGYSLNLGQFYLEKKCLERCAVPVSH